MKKKVAPSLPKTKKVSTELSDVGIKGVVHNGKLLDISKSNDIINTAISLANNQLLLDLITDVESSACSKIYFDSNSLEDLAFGKGMLNSLEILKKKILNLSKTKIK
jgi:hypothetical protein